MSLAPMCWDVNGLQDVAAFVFKIYLCHFYPCERVSVCVSECRVWAGTQGGQKIVLDLLKLELRAIVNLTMRVLRIKIRGTSRWQLKDQLSLLYALLNHLSNR